MLTASSVDPPPLSSVYLYVCGVRGAGYIKNP